MPPVPTRIQNKNIKEFNLKLGQEMIAHQSQIWVAAFSPDGTYLATGGKDAVINVWKVLSLEDVNDDPYQMFHKVPHRIFKEHELDVLSIVWKVKNNNEFLSSSLDHKIILWSVNTADMALRVFDSPDVVSCLATHPEQTNIFFAGSLDKKFYTWDIREPEPVD